MATIRYLFYVSAILCVKCVTGADLISLTFVIDDTSSMGDDIADVRRGASAIFDTVVQHKNESQIDNFIIVTFNDRSDRQYIPDLKLRLKTKSKTKAKSRKEFISALSGINVSGGAGSCAELALAGVKRGLEESLPKSTIFVFTDATAKDYNHYEEVKRLAQTKQCPIVFVITNQCGEPATAPGYKVYRDLAEATNGLVIRMKKGEINKILEYVKKTITGPRTTLAQAELGTGAHTMTFNADSLMEDLILSLTSIVSNDPSVNIKAPDGTNALKKLIFSTIYNKVYSVTPKMPGQHTVEVNSPRAPTRAVVTAKTEIDFQHGFSSFLPATIDDTSTRPAPGVKSRLSIKLTKGDIDLRSVQILDMNRNVLQTLPLAVIDADAKFYTTEPIDPPQSTFMVAIIGFDPASNFTITRQASTPVEIQKTLPGDKNDDRAPTVTIDGNGAVSVNYGEKLQLVCKVTAYPEPTIIWKNKATGAIVSALVMPGKNIPYDYINVLTIDNAKDNATYTCEARNRLNANGNPTIREVTVEVKRYLNIISEPRNISVDFGKSGRFACTVNAYPPAIITWYKNDVKLEIGGNIEMSNNNSILTVKDVKLADNGKYTCEARNEDTKQTIDNHIAVVGLERVVIDKHVSSVTVTRGQPAIVECKILTGMPKPSISWTVTTPMKYVLNVDNWKNIERNVINDTSKVDSGRYRCKAENIINSDSHEIHLIVV